MAVSRLDDAIRQAQYHYTIQTNHLGTTMVRNTTIDDHRDVYGRVRRYRQDQHRWIATTPVLPGWYQLLAVLLGLSDQDVQYLRYQCQYLWQSVFPTTGDSTERRDKQPRALRNSVCAVLDSVFLLLDIHRCHYPT